jgi:addiction module RelE/StbE family toxin
MMEVIWSPRASSDLDAIYLSIAAHNEGAASRQVRFLMAATRQLEQFPLSGRSTSVADVRELVVPRTPYIIRYSLRRNAVQLVSITHGARDESQR